MLRLEKITKAYGKLTVLDGVSLRVSAGEIVALRGRSGSGKSTLLAIAGLLASPDLGSIELSGRNVAGLSDSAAADIRRHRFGFVFQSFNLLPHLTAIENVTLPAVSSRAFGRALELLDLFGVGDRRDHLPGRLSGGEQQRVALARALINQPSVILADEPTGNLDEDSERLVLRQLRLMAADGCAVLIVSHDAAVSAVADRCLDLVGGRLEHSG